jgi:hypothetical protein
MKNRALFVSIFGLLLLAVEAFAARPEITSTIDPPGALVTAGSGINADGFVVGWYCLHTPCNAATFRGFLRNPDGSFQDVIVPNEGGHPAIGTQARYISPQGVIVGDYLTLEDGATIAKPRFRGFACLASNCSGPNAQFTYFDAPDQTADGQPVYDNPSFAHSIIPRAINATGDLVGCIHDRDQAGSMHGFLLHDGSFTRLSDSMTMNNGVNAEGDIVGLDGSSTTAYLIHKSGDVERLADTNADAINAWDINSKGEIVGQAITNNFTVGHAFLRSKDGQYRIIDPSGSVSATAFGISSSGNVVGQYRDVSGTHGFLVQRGD